LIEVRQVHLLAHTKLWPLLVKLVFEPKRFKFHPVAIPVKLHLDPAKAEVTLSSKNKGALICRFQTATALDCWRPVKAPFSAPKIIQLPLSRLVRPMLT